MCLCDIWCSISSVYHSMNYFYFHSLALVSHRHHHYHQQNPSPSNPNEMVHFLPWTPYCFACCASRLGFGQTATSNRSPVGRMWSLYSQAAGENNRSRSFWAVDYKLNGVFLRWCDRVALLPLASASRDMNWIGSILHRVGNVPIDNAAHVLHISGQRELCHQQH